MRRGRRRFGTAPGSAMRCGLVRVTARRLAATRIGDVEARTLVGWPRRRKGYIETKITTLCIKLFGPGAGAGDGAAVQDFGAPWWIRTTGLQLRRSWVSERFQWCSCKTTLSCCKAWRSQGVLQQVVGSSLMPRSPPSGLPSSVRRSHSFGPHIASRARATYRRLGPSSRRHYLNNHTLVDGASRRRADCGAEHHGTKSNRR